MSTPTPPTTPADNNGRPAKAAAPAKPAPAAVIRRLDGAAETAHERLVKKHLPAWVVSGAVHLVVIALAWVFFSGSETEATQSQQVLSTTAEKEPEEPVQDLTNEDRGLESQLEAAVPDLDRITEQTVDDVVTTDPIGVADAMNMDNTALKPPGLPDLSATTPGVMGTEGNAMMGSGNSGLVSSDFLGRSGGTKSQLLKAGGGNSESEAAVARGLNWLARQQKPNGSWVYDGSHDADTIAATGMCLLPFLAAGETHKTGKRYQQTVDRGLKFLIANMSSDGRFNGKSVTMYSQGIATIALCEAYGMTRDRGLLLRPAQAALNFIAVKQGTDGSWGYSPGSVGDTSIVGWQVQALKAGQLSKDLVVPDQTFKRAVDFLNKVSSGSRKANYGYNAPNGGPGTSLTAVGLLCRYYIDKWYPGNPGLADGVDGLMKRGPQPTNPKPDMYYYYYATQVVHFAEGDAWKDWNEGKKDATGKRAGGMRDWLIALQDKKAGANNGSWDAGAGTIGSSCGRLGQTAMSLLTLEVYYRHLPLYKREGAGGLKVLDN